MKRRLRTRKIGNIWVLQTGRKKLKNEGSKGEEKPRKRKAQND